MPPAERLFLTLRHLATDKYFLNLFYQYNICDYAFSRIINKSNILFFFVGETQESLSMTFCIDQNTVSKTVREVY